MNRRDAILGVAGAMAGVPEVLEMLGEAAEHTEASALRTLGLTGRPEEAWARWHCELNCWDWPVEWGEAPKAIAEGLALKGKARYCVLEQLGYGLLCDLCERFAGGRKSVLRYWNTKHRRDRWRMTEAEFEAWWARRGLYARDQDSPDDRSQYVRG